MIENKSASTNLRCQQPTGSTRITQNYCILMQAAYQTILAKVKIKSFIIMVALCNRADHYIFIL